MSLCQIYPDNGYLSIQEMYTQLYHHIRQEWGKDVTIFHLSSFLRIPSVRRACNPAEKWMVWYPTFSFLKSTVLGGQFVSQRECIVIPFEVVPGSATGSATRSIAEVVPRSAAGSSTRKSNRK